MFAELMERAGGRWCVVVAMGVGVAIATGCATESPKPAPVVMPEQVKSNADKSFERLKQEEKNRAAGSDAAPY